MPAGHELGQRQLVPAAQGLVQPWQDHRLRPTSSWNSSWPQSVAEHRHAASGCPQGVRQNRLSPRARALSLAGGRHVAAPRVGGQGHPPTEGLSCPHSARRTRVHRHRSARPECPSQVWTASTPAHRAGDRLTTAQGATGARHRPHPQGRRTRADAARGLPPPREDHALRPRAHPRAGGARPRRRRPRRLRVLRHRRLASPWPAFLDTARAPQTPVFVRFSTVARLARLGRHRPRRAGLRRRSSTPAKATWTWSATTSRCSSSRTASSSPTSSTRPSREPDREIPQAQTAHDTFWDFVVAAHRVDHTC